MWQYRAFPKIYTFLNRVHGIFPYCMSKRKLHVKHTRRTMSKLRHQNFDYFLVLDFEATCEKNRDVIPQEIIEFPTLLINSESLETEDIFHTYVQPRVHKNLSVFCVELTGIVQDMVDNQPHIEEVLKNFDVWMEKHIFSKNKTFAFVTCGDWDLLKMLPSQCKHFDIPKPQYFNSWINIKKAYAQAMGTYPKGMLSMMQGLQIPMEGRHHSGIDDSKNIARILKELLNRGYVFNITYKLS